MRWRAVLRISAMVLNAAFAVWLFTNAAIWGPNDYVGGAVTAFPPLVAVAALLAARPGKVTVFHANGKSN